MGADGAVNIVFRRELEAARGRRDPAERRAELIEEYKERSPTRTSRPSAGYVDDVIEPEETRPVADPGAGGLADQA